MTQPPQPQASTTAKASARDEILARIRTAIGPAAAGPTENPPPPGNPSIGRGYLSAHGDQCAVIPEGLPEAWLEGLAVSAAETSLVADSAARTAGDLGDASHFGA